MRGMRNFWIVAKCDGRRTDVAFGPSNAKDAGFSLDVKARSDGESVNAFTLQGDTRECDCNGARIAQPLAKCARCKGTGAYLRVNVFDHEGNLVTHFESRR